MSLSPSPDGSNGRNTNGQFTKGNPGGPGNPFGKRIEQIRSRLFAVVTDEDIDAIIRKTVEQAKAGDESARRDILDRLLGRPTQATVATVEMTANLQAEEEHKAYMARLKRITDDIDRYRAQQRENRQLQ